MTIRDPRLKVPLQRKEFISGLGKGIQDKSKTIISNRNSVVEIIEGDVMSTSYCPVLALNIWWEAVLTVDAAWSSNVVNLALDREGDTSSRAE